MRKGDYAELKAVKALRSGDTLDENRYICEVSHLDEKEESIYLVVKENELEELSLDYIYECKVNAQDKQVRCTGRIKERYVGQKGKTLKLLIENGFYKITIK